MIKKNQPILNILNAAIDWMILYASYFIASWMRFELLKGEMSVAQAWSLPYRQMFLSYSILMVLLFALRGFYSISKRKVRLRDEAAHVLRLSFVGVVLFTSIQYFSKAGVFFRLTYIFYYLVSVFLLVLKRMILKNVLYRLRTSGKNLKHVVVVGNGNLAKQYIDSVNNNPEFGYMIHGYVSKVKKEGLGRNLGAYEDLPEIIRNNDFDEIVVALEAHEIDFMKTIIETTEKQGIKIYVIPFYNDYLPPDPLIEEIDNVKLFSVRTTPFDDKVNAFIKRSADIVLSLLIIIITSPVMLLALIGVLLFGGKGPIIFRQERIGRNKRPFTMYKFRSMKVNSKENTGWTKDDDERKTAFGSLIRKFSIDELPQFFNVLKGDMSIVGPRPEVPHYVDQFKEEIPLYMIRHLVRPGITGWAQVNGYRGDTSIKKRIEYDIWYIEHWSVQLDISIMLRTVFGGWINNEKISR
ncbi:MAG: undecaprenyl-phosphate glucose phosphotransferase [Erysipelotrichaceae bacterium]|nr:undecaprenyl-phosphate glucose phosphotransferase [Erysipelotrichaceae bacterium]